MPRLLLSPRSKACCGVCRAYESGGGGQPQTQSDAFGRLLKAEPAPAGAGARSAGRALRVHQRPHIKPGPTMLGPALLCSAAPAAVRCCVTPHTRPPSLATAAGNGKRGHRLRAVVGAPVRPFGPSLPPPAACGPLPCPPWAAGRRPPRPAPAGLAGVMWRPRPAPWGPGPVKLAASRCTGAPLRKARPSPCGAACSGPCFAPPPCRLRRRCSGAARPPLCGGCGAVRPSGPVGGAPASRAARPRLRRWPCRPGSASALAARRSRRQPLAACSGQAGAVGRRGARLRPLSGALSKPLPACPAGRQFQRRPLGPRKRGLCPHCGRLGAGVRRLRAGYLTGDLMPRPSPCGAAYSGP